MSIRSYLSAREKRFDCLPSIPPSSQRCSLGSGLPPVSGSASCYNRNVCSYDSHSYRPNSVNYNNERSGTPFSDFFSESETGTPDLHSEESDSSAGSALRRSNAEATRTLADEWERIERTLYDEDGEKCTRPQIVEECKQWRALHPQLRILGKAIQPPEKNSGFKTRNDDHLYNDLVAVHYSDEDPMESEEERVSQSSTDVTPQNSPRVSISDIVGDTKSSPDKSDSPEPKLLRPKMTKYPSGYQERDLSDSFCSLLHITPLQIRSPSHRKRHNQSILKSEMASSKWMKNSRPESSRNSDRNSAKSFVSLDTRKVGNFALSASERNKICNSRVLTARHRDIARLQPLCTPDYPPEDIVRMSYGISYPYNTRKVSLPPLMLEEEKKKVYSVKKQNTARKLKTTPHIDRTKYNK